MRTVAANNRQRYNVVDHRNVVGVYRDANIYTAQINAIYGPGTQLLGYLGQGALLAIGGHMVVHHELIIGALVAFFLYLNRFFAPIQLLVPQYNTFQQGLVARQAAHSVRDRAEHAGGARRRRAAADPGRDRLRPRHLRLRPRQSGHPRRQPAHRAGRDGCVRGPDRRRQVDAGEADHPLLRPDEGRVLIDGHDLRDVTLDSLRRQLGVVPQEPFLFAGSLRYNIAFAYPDAKDDEVWEAVRAVGLADVVERMPDGLDTVVHERGQSLSSGERQLIALARAFLAHPRVLVLDEATSNLDLLSETKIEAALDVLLEARTAVLIAHRLTTAMKADRIVVVDDGRIVEIGSHDELIARGGRYAEMYATWTSHMELAA